MNTIRSPLPTELDPVFLMGFHAWHEGLSAEAFLEECRASKKYKTGTWYVLLDDEHHFLSKLIVYPLENLGAERTKGLASIATPPIHQRKGYAAELIRGVIEILNAQGDEHLILFSDISPTYYEKFGFRALPDRFQCRAGSICMLRSPSFELWANNPNIVPPSYF